jgi:hypothetical protein
MTNAQGTNDQQMANVEMTMRNAPRLGTFGIRSHWSLSIDWSLDPWPLVIESTSLVI